MKTIKHSSFFASVLIVIVLLTTLNSCNENSTDNTKKLSNDFLFKVTVKNSAGAAVQGLRVSAYSDPTIAGFPKNQKTAKINASSMINFALPKSCLVTLSLFELDGRTIQQPIKNSLLNAGSYAVTINIMNRSAGSRVYKAVLSAKNDTSNIELFRDSIYVALWQFDPSLSVLGYTSGAGVFETNDSLSFPNVLTIPPIVRTTEKDPTPIGMFTFPSDIVITLYDSTTHKSQTHKQKVYKGKNEFELVWNPTGVIIEPLVKNIFNTATPDTGIVGTIPTEFHLYQNYPNPFN